MEYVSLDKSKPRVIDALRKVIKRQTGCFKYVKFNVSDRVYKGKGLSRRANYVCFNQS